MLGGIEGVGASHSAGIVLLLILRTKPTPGILLHRAARTTLLLLLAQLMTQMSDRTPGGESGRL